MHRCAANTSQVCKHTVAPTTFSVLHKVGAAKPPGWYLMISCLCSFTSVWHTQFHFLCVLWHERGWAAVLWTPATLISTWHSAHVLFTAWSSALKMRLETRTGSQGCWGWYRYGHHASFCLLLSLPHELFQITKGKGQKWTCKRIQITQHLIILSLVCKISPQSWERQEISNHHRLCVL